MDCLDLKAEKANAILKYRRLQKVTIMFRFIELFIFVIVISKLSSQLPFAFKISGDYFRGLSVALISPRFVFVIGNAIIITLFLKAGKGESKDNLKVADCENSPIIINEIQTREMETVKKVCRMERSKSENVRRDNHGEAPRKLRRSATETCRKSGEKAMRSCRSEDDMSSEEFRRTVEAFIARQQKSLREEEFAIVAFGA